MNVLPPNKLIDRASSSRGLAGPGWLAAVFCGGILCGAARAQSVPAAPPVSLWDAVEIRYHAPAGGTSTVESSTDLELWQCSGSPVFGNDEEHVVFLPIELPGTGYLRIRNAALPEGGRARWSMEGCSMLFTGDDGSSFRVLLNAEGLADVEGGIRGSLVSWTWQRTGTDGGTLVLSWPDGTTEEIDLSYRRTGGGGFVSQISRGGVPAGGATGVFRLSFEEGLGPVVPESLGNAQIIFAGTGRPITVSVTEAGIAAVSSPAGQTTYTPTYTVTGTNSATLTLDCQTGIEEKWTLTFTGPGCGTFKSETTHNGILRRSGEGAFTIQSE